MQSRSSLFAELPALSKWALSFAGTWTLCLHASSYNLKNRCQHCLRTSRYLGYWKAWANMAHRTIGFCQQGIHFSEDKSNHTVSGGGRGKKGASQSFTSSWQQKMSQYMQENNRINFEELILRILCISSNPNPDILEFYVAEK